MIQRIQTVYLLITLICLGMVSFGTTLFSFTSIKTNYAINSFGVSHLSNTSQTVEHLDRYPGYLIGIGLMLLTIFTILRFKDVNKQHRLGRMLFYTYFAVLASVIVLINFGANRVAMDITGKEMGLGFFLLVVGFPFVFLANTGINRDKKLLDSLNRLR